MASPPFLAGAQALLSPCLLHHELHKLLKGQRRCREPFEWEGFEPFRATDDQPRACFRRQVQGDALASQGLAHRVIFQFNAHAAIAPHRPHQMQAITDLQPAIGIDHVGDRWQLRQEGKGRTWRTIATTAPLMWTLKVVVLLKLRGHGLDLLQARRALHAQTFFLLAAMIALDKSFCCGWCGSQTWTATSKQWQKRTKAEG